MAHPLKFPTSPEIKRVLSAVRAAGIAVSFIEIEPSRLRIFTSQEWGGGVVARRDRFRSLESQGTLCRKTWSELVPPLGQRDIF